MITDLLESHARQNSERPFLVTEAASYSFREIFEVTRKFAQQLSAAGVRRGDHVALLADNGAPYLVALFGISWLGAVPVALNTGLIADGLCYSLEQSDSKLIVADSRWIREKRHYLTPALRGLPQVSLDTEGKFFPALDKWEPAACERVPGSDVCTILYTSGTTGLPKGVMNSHDCYAAVGRDTVEVLGLTPEDRIMVFLPLFHSNPQMYALMSALTVGCALIVRPRFSASSFFDDARRFQATGITFVGTVLSILALHHAGSDTNHRIRFGIGGGAPRAVWEQIHERFGFRVHELYGMTEIGGWVTCNTAAAYRMGSVGRARKCMDVRVFDEHDREVSPGAVGEIVVRPNAPNVIFSGYYKKPEEMLRSSRNFWFHTGDQGSFDADGYLYFHGRSSELIRRGGEMISPVEIETSLRTLRGVMDCAVVGVPDPVMGEELKVAVVMPDPVAPAAIAAHLRAHLPAHMVPRYIEFVSGIPKTETEKIQRYKLKYINDSVHDGAAPRQHERCD